MLLSSEIRNEIRNESSSLLEEDKRLLEVTGIDATLSGLL
jgi:hypothetical protein